MCNEISPCPCLAVALCPCVSWGIQAPGGPAGGEGHSPDTADTEPASSLQAGPSWWLTCLQENKPTAKNGPARVWSLSLLLGLSREGPVGGANSGGGGSTVIRRGAGWAGRECCSPDSSLDSLVDQEVRLASDPGRAPTRNLRAGLGSAPGAKRAQGQTPQPRP